MNFLHSIKFKFTLWYLAILSILLIFLASGVYFTLSKVLHRNLDDTLQYRAQQLSEFKEIIAIVASGTFEEEFGEIVSFYLYSNGQLKSISNKGLDISVSPEFINQVLSGKNLFHTIETKHSGKFRLYAQQYFPDNPRIETRKFSGPPRDRRDRQNRSNWQHEDLQDRRDRYKRPREDQRNSRDRYDRPRDDQRKPRDRYDRQNPNQRPEDLDQLLEVHKSALVVARPTGDTDMALQRLLQILLFAVPLTIVFAGGGGMFLARRAFKPVDQIAKTAREIEEKDLSRRIDVQTKDELGRLAATLNQMIDRLEKAFKRQKEFTGDASHELRAPLAVIQAEVTLSLQKDRGKQAYQKSLEIVSQEADHMGVIINQLLTLARADSGKEQLQFTKINLAKFLQDLCTDIEILCQEKGLTLQLDYFENLFINGDSRSLRNLVDNLLTNAIRYTATGGMISVALLRKKNMAVISIADTGIGIPSDELPFIFERFYRVDKARSREDGGSGLGLAICKHIVNTHGGSIEVESQIQKGSTFHVKLPVL